MWGNDRIEDIEKYSGVSVGKLKIYENGILNQYDNVDENEYYDNSSNNFHIVPKAPNDYIKKIENIRHLIFDKMIKENDITIQQGRSERGLLNKNNIPESRRIEKWIEVEKDSFKYLLCFERLYIANNKVSCILGLFQFYKHPVEDNYINIINKKRILCYPISGDDGAWKTIEIKKSETLIKNYSPSSHIDSQCKFSETCNAAIHTIYNPENLPGVFELEIKPENINKVCEAFIKFINGNINGNTP